MATERKWAQNIVTDLDKFNKEFPNMPVPRVGAGNYLILWMDEKIVPGAFQMNCCWYFDDLGGRGPQAHTHDVPEIIGFLGHDPDDPNNLHGEVEIWLGDQKFTIDKSAMVFVPPGLKHCPLSLKRVDEPIFHFSVVTSGQWNASELKETHKPESDYSKYIITDLKTPHFDPEVLENYKKYATRILWMDNNVSPSAFQMNTAWYCKPTCHVGEAHKHDVPELIGFFGRDFKNPHDLGGEIEFWMEDEKYTITETCMIFIPPGVMHCPLISKRIDRPIMHFSIVTSGQYEQIK